MICGSTAIGTKIYSASDGAFSADKEVEKRLVALGVAEYVDGKAVATSGESISAVDKGVDIPGEENAAEPPYEAASDIPEFSVDTPMAELKALAKNAGIAFKANIKKEALVDLLKQHYEVADIEDIGLTTDDIVV